jgi:hypothetical protein
VPGKLTCPTAKDAPPIDEPVLRHIKIVAALAANFALSTPVSKLGTTPAAVFTALSRKEHISTLTASLRFLGDAHNGEVYQNSDQKTRGAS